MDDVQFNGGLFDMAGLSNSAKAKLKSRRAAKLPSVRRLSCPRRWSGCRRRASPPKPGPAARAIQDPDAVKKASKEELERKQAEYCKVNYEQAMGRGDETTALAAEGPLGPCRPSVMSSVKKWNAGDSE